MTTNAAELAAKMRRRSGNVGRELLKAAQIAAKELTQESDRVLQEDVYSRPEKVSPKTGERLWKRTGRLLMAEKFVASGTDVVHRNKMRYAKRRLKYGKPGGDKATAPQGPWRGWPWVARKNRGRILQLRRQAVQRAMR